MFSPSTDLSPYKKNILSKQAGTFGNLMPSNISQKVDQIDENQIKINKTDTDDVIRHLSINQDHDTDGFITNQIQMNQSEKSEIDFDNIDIQNNNIDYDSDLDERNIEKFKALIKEISRTEGENIAVAKNSGLISNENIRNDDNLLNRDIRDPTTFLDSQIEGNQLYSQKNNVQVVVNTNLDQKSNRRDEPNKNQQQIQHIRYSKMTEEEAASIFETRKLQLFNKLITKKNIVKKTKLGFNDKVGEKIMKSTKNLLNTNEKKSNIDNMNTKGQFTLNNFIIFSRNSSKNVQTSNNFLKSDELPKNKVIIDTTNTHNTQLNKPFNFNHPVDKKAYSIEESSSSSNLQTPTKFKPKIISTPQHHHTENFPKRLNTCEKKNNKLIMNIKLQNNTQFTINKFKSLIQNYTIQNNYDMTNLQNQSPYNQQKQNQQIPENNKQKQQEDDSIFGNPDLINEMNMKNEEYIGKQIKDKHKEILQNINDIELEINKLQTESDSQIIHPMKTLNSINHNGRLLDNNLEWDNSPVKEAKIATPLNIIEKKNDLESTEKKAFTKLWKKIKGSQSIIGFKNNSCMSDDQRSYDQTKKRNSLKKFVIQDDLIAISNLQLSKQNKDMLHELLKKTKNEHNFHICTKQTDFVESSGEKINSIAQSKYKDNNSRKQESSVLGETETTYATLRKQKIVDKSVFFSHIKPRRMPPESFLIHKESGNQRLQTSLSPKERMNTSIKMYLKAINKNSIQKNIIDREKAAEKLTDYNSSKTRHIKNEEAIVNTERTMNREQTSKNQSKCIETKFDSDVFYKKNIEWVKRKQENLQKKQNDILCSLLNISPLKTSKSAFNSTKKQNSLSQKSYSEVNSMKFKLKNDWISDTTLCVNSSANKNNEQSKSMVGRSMSKKVFNDTKEFMLNERIMDMPDYQIPNMNVSDNNVAMKKHISQSYAILETLKKIIENNKKSKTNQKDPSKSARKHKTINECYPKALTIISLSEISNITPISRTCLKQAEDFYSLTRESESNSIVKKGNHNGEKILCIEDADLINNDPINIIETKKHLKYQQTNMHSYCSRLQQYNEMWHEGFTNCSSSPTKNQKNQSISGKHILCIRKQIDKFHNSNKLIQKIDTRIKIRSEWLN